MAKSAKASDVLTIIHAISQEYRLIDDFNFISILMIKWDHTTQNNLDLLFSLVQYFFSPLLIFVINSLPELSSLQWVLYVIDFCFPLISGLSQSLSPP